MYLFEYNSSYSTQRLKIFTIKVKYENHDKNTKNCEHFSQILQWIHKKNCLIK